MAEMEELVHEAMAARKAAAAKKKKAARKKPASKKSATKKPATKKPATKKAAAKKPAAKKSAGAARKAPGKTALVTGAAGFVGGHVVEELIEAGMTVIATDFTGTDLSAAEAAGAIAMHADITKPDSIGEVFKLRKVDYVVHVAALYDLGATLDKLMPVNRGGTKNVCRAALEAGVEHFIYFSSGDVYGQPKKMPIDETFAPNPINPYAESKFAGEREARKFYRDHGLPVTIIRPTVIYGPRSKYVAAAFFSIPGIVKAIGDQINVHHKELTVFSGGAHMSWVHAKDLSGAVRFILGNKDTIGEVYNVADDRPITLQELFETVFGAYGYEWKGTFPYPKTIIASFAKLAMHFPSIFFMGITAFMRSEWNKTREKYGVDEALQPRFDRDFMSYMLGDRVYDNSKIKKAGYKFRYPDAIEGLKETLKWYQDNNWLPVIPDEPEPEAEAALEMDGK